MKKTLIYFFIGLLLVTSAVAQQKVINLYDGPSPGTENWNWNEAESDNNMWQTKLVYNVTKPTSEGSEVAKYLGLQDLLTKKNIEDSTLSVYLKKEFNHNGNILPYRILYPENYDKNKKYPLLLFLHGAGERGNDNEKQLIHGSKLFISEENRKNFPAIIVLPQCPQESFWASTKIDRSVTPFKIEFDYTLEPSWPLVAANELVKKISADEAVDKSRVYITGLSMGGMGTFESVFRYPELYAAAAPICGGGSVNAYDKRVTKTAFWVFHGAADAVVNVKLSQDMVTKLNELKADVKYSEYPGVNHNSWDNAFAEKEYLSWMLLHKRKK